MKILVTGASGFIGRHLVAYLARQGHSVAAVSRTETAYRDLDVMSMHGSVTDAAVVGGWLQRFEPEAVVHLAAQSLPGVSWQQPAASCEINISGTMNLLAAMKELKAACRFVMVSSSSVYAMAKDGLPIREDSRLEGSSPYAWSKLAAEQGALLYGRHHGLDVTVVRPFFVIGPGKEGDVCSDFARRIVDIERDRASEMLVGSLDITRDFVDIEDAVIALERVVERGESGGGYNICSGRGTTIRDVLETYKSLAVVPINARIDPALLRPIDEPVKVGDPSRLLAMGWKPAVTLRESLSRILDYWREAA